MVHALAVSPAGCVLNIAGPQTGCLFFVSVVCLLITCCVSAAVADY